MRTPIRLPLCAAFIALGCLAVALAGGTRMQAASVDELLSAVVSVKSFIDPEGRTVQTLGREREGSGVLIDDDGLVLTIGYLIVEAHSAQVRTNSGRVLPANVVGYDHETGFGLLRTAEPPKLKPIPFGNSAAVKEGDPVLVASAGGVGMAGAARVVSRRAFAGSWEYLLEDALFTAPPHPTWSGTALLSREGKLVGIGSLIVADAAGNGEKSPGNMFVPIEKLPPILADLLADGRRSGPGRPWLGLSTDEVGGKLVISAVSAGGPAEKAGVQRGATIVSVGGEGPKDLADFYRKIWATGSAGVSVPLEVQQGGETRRFEIRSINRLDHLRLKSTL